MPPNPKVALITGGAHRLGKAIALKLAAHGAQIAFTYHTSAAAAQETGAELAGLGVEALPLQADLSQPPEIERAVGRVVNHFGRLDILVNSAASFEKRPLLRMSVEDWDRVINLNLRGPFLCARAAAPQMLRQESGGVIINISDLSGLAPLKGRLAHSVAKAGLLALTQALALELRPAIRVNGILPGPVLPQPGYSTAVQARIAQGTLLKRWGTPEHVARVVIFLVENDYITGEILRVDGGEWLGWRDR
jgi:NAD(P)-dependent dehydrogenase (short-subunit alcohol dehydrogenase family)